MMHRSTLKQCGFSLLELMIALVVVGILAGIAVPAYTDSVRKAHRGDGIQALTEIAQTQEKWFMDNSTYSTNIAEVWAITSGSDRVTADGYYTLTMTNPATPASCVSGTRYNCFTLTATARGSQAKDTTCATMTLTHTGAFSPAACKGG